MRESVSRADRRGVTSGYPYRPTRDFLDGYRDRDRRLSGAGGERQRENHVHGNTRTGTEEAASAPMPTAPLLFDPQHQTLPSSLSAHA